MITIFLTKYIAYLDTFLNSCQIKIYLYENVFQTKHRMPPQIFTQQ